MYEGQGDSDKRPPLPDVMPNAALLKPPPPICQTESNWPLLTVSKGFFEGIKAVRGGPGPSSGPAKGTVSSALVMEEDDDIATAGGKGWGDDEEEGFGSEGDVELDGEKAAGEGSDGGKIGSTNAVFPLPRDSLNPCPLSLAADTYMHKI